MNWGGFFIGSHMVVKAWRPTNLARNWYLDHEKRLQDAIVAQEGLDEQGIHPDGLHIWDDKPWPKRSSR